MNCTINCKRLLLVFAFSYTCILATAQEKSTAAPAVKTFALQSDVNGAAANSVNLFTGDVVFPLNLISLPGHNGLDVSVSIGYNSNVQEQVGTWNRDNPNGIIGLGWSMDVPKIVVDNKQTGAKEDDEYYLLQGGSSNRLIRTTSGYDAVGGYYVYETKNYQFWKIRYYYDNYEVNGPGFSGGANKWVIITDDGTQYVYGDQYSGRHTVSWMVRWSNWIGNSARLEGQSRLAVAWNLSEVINIWNEKVTYEYEEVEQYVGSYSGQKHTEASYLKQITDVFGRKVQFYYNEKDPQWYTEPHTEQAEPDAYQEVYEKKYLDHIDVLQEDGNKLLSVHLTYTSLIGLANGATKMLLASIEQRNAAGKALPAMKFTYYNDGPPLHGYIKTVTYPTGGTVTYNYTGQILSRSNRQLTIQAPWGYSEPKVYIEEDYVVVVWRELNSDDSHSGSSKGLKVYVYSWVGEWKEQYIGQLGACELEGENYNRDYKNFQLTTQKDFFALLTPYSGSNNYNFYIVYKSPYTRGYWNTYSDPGDYGNGKPSLLSGTNFVTVASYYDDSYHPCSLYAYAGDIWVKSQLNQTQGDHYYTGSNNYFISHNRSGVGGAEINFNYLTEDRKWVTKKLDNSLVFGSNNSSFWYSSNAMAIVMARNNPEFAYLWDFSYKNFFRDETDKDGNPLFGQIADELPVFMVNNSLVGINGRIARYDGWFWHAETITSTKNSMFGNYFSYGDDFVVRPTYYYSGKYRGARKVFDPNTLNWQGDVNMDGNDAGQDVANAGIDYYYYGNGYYYRSPDGSWQKKITYDVSGDRLIPYGGFPQYDVITSYFPFPIRRVVAFKNGEVKEYYDLNGQNLLFNTVKFRSNGTGNQTIVSYPASFSTIEDAYIITLTRLVGNEMTGNQVDYPVTSITVNDGTQNRYTSFQYNPVTAVLDVTGNTAQYNEVTVVPGSASANSRPYGFTKTYFNNGLTSEELGIPYKPLFLTWVGAPYKTQVFNSNNQIVSSSETDYETYSKEIRNGDGNPVYKAYYVRPTVIKTMQDGIESITMNSYNQYTGQISQSIMHDNNSKGNQVKTTYKYFWEQYDPERSTNILAPVIQTKSSVSTSSGEVISNVTAVTWKTWNNVFAPHKTYQWKKTGAADFDFSNWSGTGEPSADWIKLSQVDAMDATGNVIQVTNR